jgi:hypothetical protein
MKADFHLIECRMTMDTKIKSRVSSTPSELRDLTKMEGTL